VENRETEEGQGGGLCSWSGGRKERTGVSLTGRTKEGSWRAGMGKKGRGGWPEGGDGGG